VELREVQDRPFLHPRKAEQLGASHLGRVLQQQIIRAEEGKVILELGEQVAGPRMEREEELREAHPLRFLRLMKVEQLVVSHLRSESQEQITQAEEGKVILEIVERVAGPRKEQEGELREAHPLRFLRPRKAEQLGASHLKSEPQEQITQAEEGKVILEIVERVAGPRMEREEELKGAHHLNSLRVLESHSESVQPRNLNQFFLQAD
jgi:hypothetical protein